MDRVFYFTANAVGVACRIRRPVDFTLEPQAASCLSAVGGRCAATAGPISFNNGAITVQRATSSCDGDFQDLARAASFTMGNHTSNDVPTRTTTSVQLDGTVIINRGPATSRQLTIGSYGFELVAENQNDPSKPGVQPVFTFQNLTMSPVAIDGAAAPGQF
jgi:hypothetical protein